MSAVSKRSRTTADGDPSGELNRAVRSKHGKLRLVEEIPFGGRLVLRRWQLGNGLQVLLMVDRSAPVVSYHTWFRVGSRHEEPGKTGLAHLFEHLMFNETETLAYGELDRKLEQAGGEANAATWTDWTYYFENLPKSKLRLAVELEADRMANLVLRDEQVGSEKEVVANERRYRVDDDIEGWANEQLWKHAFKKHPYHWPTIGWMEDIEGFTTEDCRQFYRTYYAPNNAVVVVVGDIREKDTLALVQKHYGSLRPSPIPDRRAPGEPEQRRERSLSMRRATQTEKLQLGYRSPAFGDPSWATLAVANEILSGGRSSRLYRTLVHQREIASEVRASLTPFRDPGLFEVWVSMRPGHSAAAALELVDAELERMRHEPVSDTELEKARNRLELSFVHGMETANGKAEQIGFFEAVLGDPARIFERLEEYRRVTADDVLQAAGRCFAPSRRTRLTVEPSEGRGGAR